MLVYQRVPVFFRHVLQKYPSPETRPLMRWYCDTVIKRLAPNVLAIHKSESEYTCNHPHTTHVIPISAVWRSEVVMGIPDITYLTYLWKTRGLLKCSPKKINILWVVPPPSNSDHQDYYIFTRGPRKKNLHLPRLHPGRGDNPKYTLPKLNIAPENLPSQRESSFPTTIFRGEPLNFGGVL